ncbi:endolytic transglycosylase MltG [Mycetohabitans sp. B46]|uniref:endolytic transglycosylase MltG n=1 Tax=Mycetohabitans sp. B46 TaxID=2772536 RepID=UPI00307ED0F2
MSLFKKVLFATAAAATVAVVAACGAVWYWARTPLQITPSPLDVTIKPRSSLRSVAVQLRRDGVPIEPRLFVLMARVLGLSSQLKSGNYTFSAGVTPYGVLQKVARGDVNQYVVTIIEGWTFRRMRDEINAHPALRHDSAALSDAQLMRAILADVAPTDPHVAGTSPASPPVRRMPTLQGAPAQEPEGLFFPDTYLFDKNTSDLDIYRRAYRLMHLRVQQAWEGRALGLPYATPYDALKMASIVEKETGFAQDRPLVAAVFVNRLRLSMPLQTDPTVIYGLGTSYAGRLRKQDLQTDTPYNTYRRGGLPPTPIALPGNASLEAALHPAASSALYFVARGDGSSHFSDNLGDHNKAVDKYIRGQ